VSGADIVVTGDYGEGAYGPMILLTVNKLGGIDQLRRVFESLAESPVGSVVRMEDESGVLFRPEPRALTLRLVTRVAAPRLRRRAVRDSIGPAQRTNGAPSVRSSSRSNQGAGTSI
jgi:hypothetical protein